MAIAANTSETYCSDVVDKPQTIDAVLFRSAVLRPDQPALIASNGHGLTYDRLAHEIASVRDYLLTQGVRSADRVALVTPRGVSAVAAFLAIAGCATLVPVEADIAEREFEDLVSRLAIRFVVTTIDCPPAIAQVAHRAPVDILCAPAPVPVPLSQAFAGKFDPAHLVVPPDVGLQSPAILLRTSGTTSRSKIVPITHLNLLACIEKVAPWYNLTPADRCLSPMPLYHGHGFTVGMLVPFLTGGSAIMPDVLDVQALVELLETGSPSWMTAAASFYRMILSYAAKTGKAIDAPAMRFMRSSSEAISPADVEAIEALMGIPVSTSYGSSEAQSHIIAKPFGTGASCIGLIGFPVTSEIAVLDGDGMVQQFGDGELLVRGDTVFSGYIDDPEANAVAFHGEWFRTGDFCRIEIDGSLSLSGRLKEIISRGGEKVAPAEIEDVLSQHPQVAEAVAFGVPHRTLGEEVCAAVTLVNREGGDERQIVRDIRRHAAAQLRAYKIPKKIFVLDTLPRGRTGKLDRRRVAQELVSA